MARTNKDEDTTSATYDPNGGTPGHVPYTKHNTYTCTNNAGNRARGTVMCHHMSHYSEPSIGMCLAARGRRAAGVRCGVGAMMPRAGLP